MERFGSMMNEFSLENLKKASLVKAKFVRFKRIVLTRFIKLSMIMSMTIKLCQMNKFQLRKF
jgi:hypothetical protein